MEVDGWPVLAPAPRSPVTPREDAPTFSVCIASYQAAGTLGAAIDSALAQTVPPFEVVVVDDGSTDGTPAVLARYADDGRVRVLRQQNQGEPAAKNAAVGAASGEFVVLLDADDVYLPQRLEALTALARARPDLDMLTTDAWIVHGGRRVGRVYHPGWPFEVEDQRRALLVRNPVFGHVAVRRERWLELGGSAAAAHRAEDWDLWQRLVLSGSLVGLVDQPLSEYAVSMASRSADRVTMHEARARLLERTLRRDDLSPQERRLVREEMRAQRGGAALGRLKQAVREQAGGPERRRLACQALVSPAVGVKGRAGALAALVAPGLVARRLAAQDDGTVAVAGGVRVPAP